MSAACKIVKTFASHFTSRTSLAVESSQEVQDEIRRSQMQLHPV